MYREVELKWKIRSLHRFQAALWKLAISPERIRTFRKYRTELRALSAREIRAKEGPNILGEYHRVFERNTMFVTPNGQEVRLRMIGKHGVDTATRTFELTVKHPVQDPVFQVRDETTLLLGNQQHGNEIMHFLRVLGWQETDVYECQRTDMKISGVVISLREFPVLGNWIEIEGTPDDIRRVAKVLGLSMDKAVNVGWRTIWKNFCEKNPGYDPHRLMRGATRGRK